MISKLMYGVFKSKYCRVCAVSLGLTYIVFKSTNVHKHLLYACTKWLKKNEVTCIVSSVSNSNFVVQQLLRRIKEKQIVGLDCEWVSTKGKRHPVALLQLAVPDGFCALFQLSLMKTVPKELVDVLEDKNILKVGVAVVADAKYLFTDYGVRCEGCLDLRYLAAQAGIEPRGLANLAKQLFDIELDKDWRVRCSNWESDTLSPAQLQYAAQDARIALDIFDRLNHKEICRKHSLWKRLFWSKKEYWHHTVSLWSSSVGLNFKNRGGSDGSSSGGKKPKHVNTVVKRNYNTLLHSKHYSNNFLLAPDGQVLCTISNSKATWYLHKELAEVVCEEPRTLRLKFEPARRANEPDGYYTKPKDNRCVVCGCESDLMRKNVVPYEYRKHFEEGLKNHHSHDVLLLCLSCHTRSNTHDQSLRERLVVECDAPLGDGMNSKLREMPDLKALRNAARAIYHSGDVLPQERKAFLESVICDKMGISSDQVTWELLEDVINIDCHIESDKYMPHGQKVVMHYKTEGGAEALERRWRQHFLDSMTPQFLPDLWSVDHVRD